MKESFVAKASEMHDGDRRIVTIGGREIGVFCKDGRYYAYRNVCVHAGGPACEGLMINRVIDVIDEQQNYRGQTFSKDVHFVCPWHGYEYDLETGTCVGEPSLKLRKYEVIQRDNDIFVVA